MHADKYIGKFVTIKYSDRETPFAGFVIDVAEEWTLLKETTGDYVMDGYVLLRHKNIEYIERGSKQRFREKVIRVKGEHKADIDGFPMQDLGFILRHLSRTYGCFSVIQAW